MKETQELTRRQKQIYDFIADYIKLHSKPPTFREIGAEFDIRSTNGVRSILSALSQKGHITIESRVSRGIQLVHTQAPLDQAVEIPIVGRVAAGSPILAVENIEGTVVVDATFFRRSRDIFALRVQGDSMVNAGIFDGDLIFVRQSVPASKGDIVVAVIGSDVTVKRYFPESNRIRLEPENPQYGPVIIDKNVPDFRIAGK
ncbi:MAG: repressor LexA, partial [Candidatus Raymondbacteria bacterium RifOxyB12_full_50_8]